MDQLLAGYRRYRAGRWSEQREVMQELAANGQQPRALLIACVDSRVDPATIFDAAPGELLTLRNVANLVPPCTPDDACHGTSAGLEFGVRVLGVPHIVVMGHSGCGGVQALLDGATPAACDFVAPWMRIAAPARDAALQLPPGPERRRRAELAVVEISLANLRTFPWIADRVAAATLQLHGAWFDLASGELSWRLGESWRSWREAV